MAKYNTTNEALDALEKQTQHLDWNNKEHQKRMKEIILEIVNETSVEATGKVTVLYSGQIYEHHATDIAKQMSENSDIRILDKTPAFKLLEAPAFKNIMAKSLGYSSNDQMSNFLDNLKKSNINAYYNRIENQFQFNGKDGLWAVISRNFAKATEGEVRILTINPRIDSVLVATELEAILDDIKNNRSKITMINGSSIEEIKQADNLKSYIINSAAVRTLLASPTVENYATWATGTAEQFKKLMQDSSDELKAQIEQALDVINNHFGKPFLPSTLKNTSNLESGKALPIVGLGFTILALMSLSKEVQAAEADGDTERAQDILIEFGVGELGSMIAGGAGATVGGIFSAALVAKLSAIVTLGMVSPAIIATASLVTGIVAGLYGEDIAKELYRLTKDMDNNGRRDLFDRLATLTFGQNFEPKQLPEHLQNNAVTLHAEMPLNELIAKAKTNIAYRYALRELMPVVAENASEEHFEPYNQDGSLHLYDENNPQGMTDAYIRDRAAMLILEMRYLKHGLKLNRDLVDDIAIGDHDYIDYNQHPFAGDPSRPFELSIDGKGIMTDNHRILFGSTAEDRLEGSKRSDRIYAGAGIDIIDGGHGNDYLEGGTEADIYHIQDHDIVFDVDAQGSIFFKEIGQAQKFIRTTFNNDIEQWESVNSVSKIDGKFLAQRIDNDLIIRDKVSNQNSVRIKHFFIQANDGTGKPNKPVLGIHLQDRPNDTNSDKAPSEFKATINKHNTINPNKGSHIIEGGQLNDWLFGSKAELGNTGIALKALLGDGDDRALGSVHRDWLEGGAGVDVLQGDKALRGKLDKRSAEEKARDADVLIGNDDGDYLFGMAGNDVLHGGNIGDHLKTHAENKQGDWILGGEGDDIIYGSAHQDILQGSEGLDTIYGGANHDLILGDAYIRPYVDFKSTPDHAGNLATDEHTQNEKGHWRKQGLATVHRLHIDEKHWQWELNSEQNDYTIIRKSKRFDANEHLVAEGGGDDILYGGSGNDFMVGQIGNDTLYGEEGDDVLFGDDNRDLNIIGDDSLYGGLGNDTLHGDLGCNYLNGGMGFDHYLLKAELLNARTDTRQIIDDEDGKGAIIINNQDLSLLTWTYNKNKDAWSAKGTDILLYPFMDTLLIHNSKREIIAEVKNFKQSALGIQLADKAKNDHSTTTPETKPNQAPKMKLNLSLEMEDGYFDMEEIYQISGGSIENHGTFSILTQSGQDFSYTLPLNTQFIDPDGDLLSYTITTLDDKALPNHLNFNPNTLTLSGTIKHHEPISLKITAKDPEGNHVSTNLFIKPQTNNIIKGTLDHDYLLGGDNNDTLKAYSAMIFLSVAKAMTF